MLRWGVDVAPGLGVLRDGQKWVALAMPGYALAGAGAVAAPAAPAAAGAGRAGVLCGADPGAARSGLGVAGRVDAGALPGRLGGGGGEDQRRSAAGGRAAGRHHAALRLGRAAPVLDPLPRWVRADVLTTGDLGVGGQTVTGEGTHARAVQQALLSGAEPAALGVLGVGWVVKESGTDGDMGSAAKTLMRLPVSYRDTDLTLYRVGGRAPKASVGPRRAAVAAHLGWLAMLVVGAGGLAVGRRWTPSPFPRDPPSVSAGDPGQPA